MLSLIEVKELINKSNNNVSVIELLNINSMPNDLIYNLITNYYLKNINNSCELIKRNIHQISSDPSFTSRKRNIEKYIINPLNKKFDTLSKHYYEFYSYLFNEKLHINYTNHELNKDLLEFKKYVLNNELLVFIEMELNLTAKEILKKAINITTVIKLNLDSNLASLTNEKDIFRRLHLKNIILKQIKEIVSLQSWLIFEFKYYLPKNKIK